MRKLLSTLLIAAIGSTSLSACAGTLVSLEIVNRSTGQPVATYAHRGQTWIAGNPGDRYAIRLINHTGGRLLAVLSVDGINVVTGDTAAASQSGYVLDPHTSHEISGWRKSMQDVAAFYFTPLPDSYAARTDRPDNVGVIGVAAYRERVRAPVPEPMPAPSLGKSADTRQEAAGSAAPAPAEAKQRKAESERLGTGHGERQYSPTEYTAFERATSAPAEIVTIRYDSLSNLMAKGIAPRPKRYPDPHPFPGDHRFVPDPRG